MTTFLINSRDQLLRLETDKIVYFEAVGNYTVVMMANKLKGTIGLSLSNMEKALASQLKDDASSFIRVGKRFIINRKYIYEVSIAKQRLVLSDFSLFAFKLPISKAALKNIKELILQTKE